MAAPLLAPTTQPGIRGLKRQNRVISDMSTQTYLSAGTGSSSTTLLEQAAHGDQLAWRQLVEKYDRLVRSVAGSFRLQAADVHDVAQTTWLRLVQNLHTIRDPERLAGWLTVTASRESLGVLRRASRYAPMVADSPDPAVDTESSVTALDTADELWATVAELPPRQQRLLIALFREELKSYNEVAAHCAMPIGSIGPTRARALSHLQRKLAERGLGPADL
jgi:RNA polymerase sigma factor (sigma-70 family)